MDRRRGFTLLELIVVIAILGVLFALLLPAIQKVRELAARTQSSNKLRQINMAVHNYAASDGELPTIDGRPKRVWFAPLGMWANKLSPVLFEAILPHLEGASAFTQQYPDYVPVYLNNSDPGLALAKASGARALTVTSYAANAQVFVGTPSLNRSFPDGLSSTIFFAEHYSYCGTDRYVYTMNEPNHPSHVHRPTFADGGSILNGVNEGDVHPVTSGNPAVTRPSRPGATFQVAPRAWAVVSWDDTTPPFPDACDWSVPQSPHRGGMLVALGDGSVRFLRQGMSPETFWAAVTPAGGEVLAGDW